MSGFSWVNRGSLWGFVGIGSLCLSCEIHRNCLYCSFTNFIISAKSVACTLSFLPDFGNLCLRFSFFFFVSFDEDLSI